MKVASAISNYISNARQHYNEGHTNPTTRAVHTVAESAAMVAGPTVGTITYCNLPSMGTMLEVGTALAAGVAGWGVCFGSTLISHWKHQHQTTADVFRRSLMQDVVGGHIEAIRDWRHPIENIVKPLWNRHADPKPE